VDVCDDLKWELASAKCKSQSWLVAASWLWIGKGIFGNSIAAESLNLTM